MRALWKFTVAVDGGWTEHKLPATARVLHVECQNRHRTDAVEFWAEVEDDLPMMARAFTVIGTGMPVPERGKYLGTALTEGGRFVWHLYEVAT